MKIQMFDITLESLQTILNKICTVVKAEGYEVVAVEDYIPTIFKTMVSSPSGASTPLEMPVFPKEEGLYSVAFRVRPRASARVRNRDSADSDVPGVNQTIGASTRIEEAVGSGQEDQK